MPNNNGLYAYGGKILRVNLSDSPDCTGALFHGVKLVGAYLAGSNFAGTTF